MSYKGFLVRSLAVSDRDTCFWTPWADVSTPVGIVRRRLCFLRGPSHVYMNEHDARFFALRMAEIWIDGYR
jgi:hypothetical protein